MYVDIYVLISALCVGRSRLDCVEERNKLYGFTVSELRALNSSSLNSRGRCAEHAEWRVDGSRVGASGLCGEMAQGMKASGTRFTIVRFRVHRQI